MTTSHEINVSFDNTVGYQEDIEEILARHGYEYVAGGGGPEIRDAHFARPEPHVETELAQITDALRALNVPMTVTSEVWIEKEDGNSEPDDDHSKDHLDTLH